jgi:hypothetical protein
MFNAQTTFPVTTHNGRQTVRVRAHVAKNGGAHGSPFDVAITEIALMASDGVSVLATWDRDSLECELEELNGKSWAWLEERLVDRFVEDHTECEICRDYSDDCEFDDARDMTVCECCRFSMASELGRRLEQMRGTAGYGEFVDALGEKGIG